MKAATVYAALTTAFILLLLLSHFTDLNNKRKARYALNRRLAFKVAPFDPLENQLSRQNSTTDKSIYRIDPNVEQYFSEGRLNVTFRLMVLFPFLEREPKDGTIDSKELEAWMMQQTIDQLHSMTQKELQFYDKNGDKAISFAEYLPQFSTADIEKNEMGHGQAGWWKEQFDNADSDQSGTLDFYEFRDFLHPEDSKNELIQNWLLKNKIRQLDYDNDKKINFMEFRRGIYDNYKNYVEFEISGATADRPIVLFSTLDVDNDGLLDADELKPLHRYLCPGELAHAKYYATYVIQEADENGDKKLTLDEMLNHDYLFYNTLHDEHEDFHDEL